MEDGYRIVTDTGKNSCQINTNNLFIHVIGGQQLLWPPTLPLQISNFEEKKEESKIQSSN